MEKKKVPMNTVTRDVKFLAEPTGNLYETVSIIAKRANQIAAAEKKELSERLEEVRSERDSMEEVFDNHEQIAISKHFEKLPKPSLVATEEFLAGELDYRFASEAEQAPEASDGQVPEESKEQPAPAQSTEQ